MEARLLISEIIHNHITGNKEASVNAIAEYVGMKIGKLTHNKLKITVTNCDGIIGISFSIKYRLPAEWTISPCIYFNNRLDENGENDIKVLKNKDEFITFINKVRGTLSLIAEQGY